MLLRRKRNGSDIAVLTLREGREKTFKLKGPDVNDVISRSFKMLEEKYGVRDAKGRKTKRRQSIF